MRCLQSESLQSKRKHLLKSVAMVGGFLIMIGIILLGVAALALSGYLDASILLEEKYLFIFATVMIVLGLVDTFTAIVIARW